MSAAGNKVFKVIDNQSSPLAKAMRGEKAKPAIDYTKAIPAHRPYPDNHIHGQKK